MEEQQIQSSCDFLNLTYNPFIRQIIKIHLEDVEINLKRMGKTEDQIKDELNQKEEVQLSCLIEKVNKFGISQVRYLLIT